MYQTKKNNIAAGMACIILCLLFFIAGARPVYATATTDTQQSMIHVLSSQNDALNTKNLELTRQNEALAAEKQELEKQLEQLTERVDQLYETVPSSVSASVSGTTRAAQADEKLKVVKAYYGELNGDYQTAVKRASTLQTKNETLTTKNAALTRKTETLNKKNETLTVKNQKLETINQTLTDTNASLRAQVGNLRESELADAGQAAAMPESAGDHDNVSTVDEDTEKPETVQQTADEEQPAQQEEDFLLPEREAEQPESVQEEVDSHISQTSALYSGADSDALFVPVDSKGNGITDPVTAVSTDDSGVGEAAQADEDGSSTQKPVQLLVKLLPVLVLVLVVLIIVLIILKKKAAQSQEEDFF